MVLPYFAPVPRQTKAKINRAFWRRMRRTYGEIAYIHGLHEQNGLLHVNYHALSNQPFEPDLVYEFWRSSLPANLHPKLVRESCTIEPALAEKRTVQYLLKYWNDNPDEYLPERGAYRKLFFTSPNYNSFITSHLTETLADGVVGVVGVVHIGT
jgi:hypothetical protein